LSPFRLGTLPPCSAPRDTALPPAALAHVQRAHHRQASCLYSEILVRHLSRQRRKKNLLQRTELLVNEDAQEEEEEEKKNAN
jgi:hypothetical protein